MPGESCINVLIVDDEPLARERIRDILQTDPEIQIIGDCANGDEALAVVKDKTPDLIFLDIQMPHTDGFEVLEALAPNEMPIVIFVTAYDQYAVRAFDVYALDYLLKPFDRERFEKALWRAKFQIFSEKRRNLGHRILSALEEIKTRPEHLDRLVIKMNGHVFFVKTEEVDWIEAEGNYVRLHVRKETYLLRDTISGLESQLDPKSFLRVHRSAIINIDRVQELQPWFHGEYKIVMQGGAELTLSRTYRDKLNEFLGRHL